MRKLLVDYMCLPQDRAIDGGVIYDRRLIDGLTEIGVDVKIFEIAVTKKSGQLFPLWSRGLKNAGSLDLRQGALRIVSHELLIPLVCKIKPEVFIVHNFLPAFQWDQGRIKEHYFRLGSHNYFREAFGSAKNVVVLSVREQSYINDKWAYKTCLLPPGINVVDPNRVSPIDMSLVRRTGSTDWYPKRKSVIPDNEIMRAFHTDNINYETELNLRGFGLIEDQFLSGFKLKLLEYIQNGDFVVSRVDLQDEIGSLGLNGVGFFHWNSKELPLLKLKERFLSELDADLIRSRRKYLNDQFSWTSIAQKVLGLSY